MTDIENYINIGEGARWPMFGLHYEKGYFFLALPLLVPYFWFHLFRRESDGWHFRFTGSLWRARSYRFRGGPRGIAR